MPTLESPAAVSLVEVPAAPGGRPAVEIAHLRKSYGTLVAVDDVSFTVAEGEIFGILGPNGAGKTTAVECAIGLRRPDAGTIRLLGLDPHAELGAAQVHEISRTPSSSSPERTWTRKEPWHELAITVSITGTAVAEDPASRRVRPGRAQRGPARPAPADQHDRQHRRARGADDHLRRAALVPPAHLGPRRASLDFRRAHRLRAPCSACRARSSPTASSASCAACRPPRYRRTGFSPRRSSCSWASRWPAC